MLGRYLPNLVAADRDWVSERLPLLFPLGRLGRITWEVYVEWFQPDPGMFVLLESEFLAAIRRLPDPAATTDESAKALVNHLAPLYWSGHLELDTGLLKEFFSLATVPQRAEFTKYVGLCFKHTDDRIEESILARAQELWASRRRAIEEGITTAGEWSSFGWWFASAKFPDSWALRELRAVLAHQPNVDVPDAVADRLAMLAQSAPRDALECLWLLCADDPVGWRVSACRGAVESTVRQARRAGDPEVARLASELVSRLVAQGHVDFLPLAQEAVV